MWQVEGFESMEKAKKFQKEHGGYLCWEERTPKRKKLTARGRDYMLATQAIGLNREKFPYVVQWRI